MEYQETSSVNELLNQYQGSLKQTRKLSNNIKKQIEALEEICRNPSTSKLEKLNSQEKLEILYLDIKVVASWEQNLSFCIDWMKTGRMPGQRRGIERRASYEREIPFENQWIQKRKAKSIVGSIDILLEDKEQEELLIENENLKRNLINKLMSTLTNRQQEIIELIAAGYSQEEVGEMIKISQQAVSKAIAKCKEKISDAGWFMI